MTGTAFAPSTLHTLSERHTQMLKRISLALTTGLLLFSPAAFAQSDPDRDDETALEEWAEDLERPLARALAFERRDVIEEMLLRPSSLSAASPAELAREASIPISHAKTIVEGVKAGNGTAPLKLAGLLKLGLPAGFAGNTTTIASASEGKLVELGMSKAEAVEFARYRRSAQRTHQHFREVRAIREARSRGASEAVDRARRFRSGSMGDRARMIADGLGLRLNGVSDPVTERARMRARLLEGTAEAGPRDAMARFRNSDGTLDWKRVTKSEVFRGAGGVAHFGFALFLKELALVMHTGDRGRMEAFVDGLMTTDFFVNYGLFAAGARAADAVYGTYVRRLTRKRFLHGVLRSHLVLAAGLAVPMLVRGQFSLDTYLVDVAALGLSATAVKVAAEGARGVFKLVRGGRGAMSLGRLAGPVGWIYTAGETAVVLLLGDYLAKTFDDYTSERDLNKRIKGAERLLNKALGRSGGGGGSDGDVAEAVADLEDAYNALRRHRATPLEARVAGFRDDLNGASRESLQDDTEMAALAARLESNPNLAAHFADRYGSVDAFLSNLRASRERQVEGLLRGSSESFDSDWEGLVRDAYVGETTSEDPTPAGGSRMALYDEETSLLLRALDGTSDAGARRHIALAIERVRLGRTLDRSVYETATGDESMPPEVRREIEAANAPGLVGAVNQP